MIQSSVSKETFLAEFARLEKEAFKTEPDWLLPLRKSAIAKFSELGFPTTRHEEWRYTNVAPIAETSFRSGEKDVDRISDRDVAGICFCTETPCRLVFVNGFFAEKLSSTGDLPANTKAMSLTAAMREHSAILEPHLGRHARFNDQSFVALNTALMRDGAFIHVPRGVVCERPIHVIHVSTSSSEPIVSHMRTLIVADANSQVAVVESFVGLGEGAYFVNAVTEIAAAENAVIDHYKIQRETDASYHMGAVFLHQYRSSNVKSHTVTFGGGLIRNDVDTVLDGEGCDSNMYGLYLVTDDQHVDSHLHVEHVQPHCNSRQYYKGVLEGNSRGIFSGRIYVHKGAQKTDAKQTNMSLLLSRDAHVECKPQLEIFADDVKCTHGATIGQIDDEAMFYLCSRGISRDAAKSLLVYAFARQNLNEIAIEPLRAQLEKLLLARLPQGKLLQEAV